MANLPAYKDVDDFWSGLVDRFGNALRANRPSVDRVGAIVSTNWYQVYGAGQSYDANSEELPRLSLSRPTVGKRVLVVRTDSGERIVLGGIFEDGDNDDVAYQTELDAVNTALDSRLDTLEALNPILIGDIDDHVVWAENSGSNAITSSTTNTTTPQTALSVSLTLPGAGSTWHVMALGFVDVICSTASQTANINTKIDGVLGTNKTSPPLSTSVYSTGKNSNARGGIAGNQTITVEVTYYANAGTVTARNPQIAAFGRRQT